VLLITGVGRDEEKRAVIQATAHVPYARRRVHPWRRKCVLIAAAHHILPLTFLQSLFACHSWVGKVETV